MRVWIVNQYAGLPARPGGTRHYSLARELIRRGHQPVIIGSSFAHMTRSDTGPAEADTRSEQVDGVPFMWLRTPPYEGNSLARIKNMLTFSRRVWREDGLAQFERPDVIVGSSPHLFAALSAERLARRYGVPFVLEVRDLWPQTLVDLGQFSPFHPAILAFGMVERYLYHRASRIISLLPLAHDHMAAKGADPAAVVWIPNGVDLSLIPPTPCPSGRDGFTVIYAGAHGLSNQLSTVLEAAYHLEKVGAPVRFRLIGDGPEKGALREMAQRFGLRSVQFEDPVPKAEIFAVLQEADAFIITHQDAPLYRWGMSQNKLFDYLAVGRPIICGSNCPYNPVAEAKAGFVVHPTDSIEMAAAVRRMADTPWPERQAMGERGRAFAELHHRFEHLGERFEQVLRDCVAGVKP